ncbi:MAG: hypothetical protein ACJ74S_04535 [Gaiellaceae bacterium]
MAARWSAVGLVAVLALAGAGCGGSKSPSEEYAARVSSMCEDFAKREQKIGQPAGPDDLAARGDRIVAAFEEAILRPLRELEAPPELATEAAQLRTLTRQQDTLLRGLAAAGKRGDLGAVRRLVVQNAQVNAQAGQIADRLGAESCTSAAG